MNLEKKRENEKKNINRFDLSKSAQRYLRFVSLAFCGACIICAGLYCDVFGFVDRVNAYLLADELMHSMIRATAAAVMMTLTIDLLSRRCGEE